MKVHQLLREDPLHDVTLQMAIRKELGVDQRLAAEVLLWLRDGTSASSEDEQLVFSALSAKFHQKLNKNHVPAHDVDEMLQMWMTELLRKKHKLELNESQDTTLLGSIISNLLKKGEKVAAYAEVWKADPGKMKPAMYPVVEVRGKKIVLQVGTGVRTWFELNGDEQDSQMHFKKEGDTWVIAEKNRKFIRT